MSQAHQSRSRHLHELHRQLVSVSRDSRDSGQIYESVLELTRSLCAEVENFCVGRAGIPGVLTAHHSYRLEPTQGGTRLIQHEVDNGVAMLFWDSSWVQPTHEEVNQAFKLRVEGLREAQR